MKFIIAASLIIATSFAQAMPQSNQQASLGTLYSQAGYPYDLLINSTDLIKIIYTIKEQEVTCSVLLEDGEMKEESATIVVTKKHFDQDPLASCLVRDKAKTWLSKIF
jgi:hypothetical protein